jgi:uncharacterized protein YaiI (UPF0178 family)
LRIWIDNDGCPRLVREMVFKTSQRRSLAVAVVGNSFMHVPPGGLVIMTRVTGAFDAADDHIAANVEAGDLVITADVPLANRIVGKGAWGLSPHGEVFDSENIGERLATRNLLQELRSGDEVRGGPPPFGEGDKKRFADALDRLVTRLMR